MSSQKARRTNVRRAFNLLELIAVVAIIGILATASVTNFGFSTLGNGGAEGFARKLSLALVHARRATIASGDNHYLLLTTSGSNVTSYALWRRASGGDVQVDENRAVPTDITVTTAAANLEFDFDGSSLAAYAITVAGPDRSWNVSVAILTGAVQVTENP